MKNNEYPERLMGVLNIKYASQIIRDKIIVAISEMYQLDAINCVLSFPLAPDKKRIIAVRVTPKRNISKKFPAAI